ncbi:hypothetical protein EMCRGX_G022330 [Ephydatia muelleri]
MRYHITSVHGIKALQQGSKKEEMDSSCSTNTASATTSVKGPGYFDILLPRIFLDIGTASGHQNLHLSTHLSSNGLLGLDPSGGPISRCPCQGLDPSGGAISRCPCQGLDPIRRCPCQGLDPSGGAHVRA